MDPATKARLDALEKRLDSHEALDRWRQNLALLAMISVLGFLLVRWIETYRLPPQPQPWYEDGRR